MSTLTGRVTRAALMLAPLLLAACATTARNPATIAAQSCSTNAVRYCDGVCRCLTQGDARAMVERL